MKEPSRVIVIALTVILLGVMSMYTVIILNNKPVDSLNTAVIILALPVVGYLGVRIHSKLNEVDNKVNGRMTELLSMLRGQLESTSNRSEGSSELRGTSSDSGDESH